MADLGSTFADFFSREAGQGRRKRLNKTVNENLDYFLGPTGIPDRLRAVNAFFNPVVGLEDAGVLTGQAFDPTLSTEDRMRAAGGALLETAMAAAPAFGVAKAGQLAAKAPAMGRTALDVGEETARRGLAETLALGAPDTPYAAPPPPALPAPARPMALPTPEDGLGTRIFRPDGQLDINATITQAEENQRLLNGGLTNREMEAERLRQMAEEGAPTAIDAPDVISLSGPRYPQAPRDADTGILFSQAYQSALDLKQNKGTVEQLRKQLINSGTKPEELEFRGFDIRFSDPKEKITKQDLIDFFDETDGDVVNSKLFTASEGKTGGEDAMSDSEVFDEYIAMNLDSEVDYYLTEYLPERLQDEYMQVRDLSGDELIEVAEREGFDTDPESLDEFVETYGDSWDVGETLYDNEADAISAAFGDPYELAEQSLRENAEYGMTRDEIREYVLGDAGGGFDPGDTTYSRYMLPGVDRYFENVFETNLPSGTAVDLSSRRPYTGGHPFDHGDVRDQNFWVRGGFLPQTETGPENVRALMEIQSDLSQRTTAPGKPDPKGRKPERRTLAEDLELAALADETRALRDQQNEAYLAINELLGIRPGDRPPSNYTPEGTLRDILTSQMLDEDGLVNLTGRGQRVNGGRLSDSLAREAIARNFTLPEDVNPGDLPPHVPGAPWQPNRVRQSQTDLVLDSRSPDNRQYEMMIRRNRDGGRELVDWRNQMEYAEQQRERGELPTVNAPDPDTAQNVFRRSYSRVGQMFDPTDADISGDGMSLGFATAGTPRFSELADNNPRAHHYPVEEMAEARSPLRQTDPDQPLLPGFEYAPENVQFGEHLSTIDNLKADGSKVARMDELASKAESAPFQQRDVGPIRAALARHLADAVAEGDKALVTGTGRMANQFTMLPSSKFYVYDKETPKVLQKILDKAAPGTKIEPIKVHLPEAPGADHRGMVELMGVRLTEEVRRLIEYNGIPYFSIGGGMVVLGAPELMGPRQEQPGSA